MKKLFSVLGIVAVSAALGVTAVHANDWVFTNFRFGSVDYVLPPQPCGAVGFASVQMWFFDNSAWASYVCNDLEPERRVIQRRFFHPRDNEFPPATVYATPQQVR